MQFCTPIDLDFYPTLSICYKDKLNILINKHKRLKISCPNNTEYLLRKCFFSA